MCFDLVGIVSGFCPPNAERKAASDSGPGIPDLPSLLISNLATDMHDDARAGARHGLDFTTTKAILSSAIRAGHSSPFKHHRCAPEVVGDDIQIAIFIEIENTTTASPCRCQTIVCRRSPAMPVSHDRCHCNPAPSMHAVPFARSFTPSTNSLVENTSCPRHSKDGIFDAVTIRVNSCSPR